MNKNFLKLCLSEPFRLFFPIGVICLLVGILLWVPLIWTAESYPVTLHRFLVLNGFVGSFVGGFLMTAVPRFSKTFPAKLPEVLSYLIVLIAGLGFAIFEQEVLLYAASALQAFVLLSFIFQRIFKRKENPPFTFIFIFVGLFLWLVSALLSIFVDSPGLKEIHYEGAIVAIILGVGSRLIPGIFGHVEIVSAQRELYEKPVSLFKTVPLSFLLLVALFACSYLFEEKTGAIVRAVIVLYISLRFWKLFALPKVKTSLTKSLWICSWCIVLSFILKAFWNEGLIHASHALFISGTVLICFLIATRVLQSHGPKDASLENWKGLYVVTSLIVLAAATRVSAYLLPESYTRHLGYSSLVLTIAVLVWSFKYLRFVRVK